MAARPRAVYSRRLAGPILPTLWTPSGGIRWSLTMRMVLALGSFLLAAPAIARPLPAPVIDMHLHAYEVGEAKGARACPGSHRATYPAVDLKAPFDPGAMSACTHPFRAPLTDDALMRDSLAMLFKYNIRHAVTSGDVADVARWRAAAPDRIIPALGFADGENLSVETYRRLYRDKSFEVFAEVETQYRGVDAGDPRWEPYFALAEELDIPIGIHFGEGPPAAAWFPGYETYRARLTSPFQLEEVLYRHPRLRIYAMHYGSPLSKTQSPCCSRTQTCTWMWRAMTGQTHGRNSTTI